MKRLITLVLLATSVIFTNTSKAQSAKMVKLDGINTVPTTMVTATFTVKKESIRSGPYARFSQKFLGVIAPLTNKDIYTIVDSQLAYTNGDESNTLGSCVDLSNFDNTAIPSISAFSKVTEDRLNNITSSPEDMARNAANTIFSLRKSRVDLITGEAGENVFNEGLQYALIEIEKLETEILALFLGKQMVSYETKAFNVVPDKDKRTNIIARFSTTSGIVSESDMSGQPIALNVQIVDEVVAGPTKRKKKSPKNSEPYFVPAQTVCQLFNGNDLLTKLDAQIYQLGHQIMVPIPEVK